MEVPAAPSGLVNGYGLLIDQTFKPKWRGDAVLNFPDQSVFEGQWVNNAIHGYGKFSTQEGKQIFGNWNQGQMIYTLPE